MTEIFDWQQLADPRVAIRRAVEALQAGQLVGVPTETVYGVAANAASLSAVERLVQCKGRPDGKPLTLALPDPLDIFDWVPQIDELGRRLCRRGWPGPLTIVFSAGLSGSALDRLPEDVRRRVSPEGTLGVRVPAHEGTREILRQARTPVVLTSANRSGEPEAVSGKQVAETLGDHLQVVIDDGVVRYGQASSVVRLTAGRWECLRIGVLPEYAIERMACRLYLFVCTGNTCRSPLAAGICRKLLAEKLNCPPEELPRRGILVSSAGMAAMMGCAASPEAVDAARNLGVDLDEHVSQPLTRTLLAEAEYVFTMTRAHSDALAGRFAGLPARVELISPDGDDIPDPIGGDMPLYEECARRIMDCLHRRLAGLEI